MSQNGSGRKPAGSGASPATALRGRQRLMLISDLAMGEWSLEELATRMGLPVADIRVFAETYAHEISEVSQALAGHLSIETAGLWVTKKQHRMAEYQAEIEEIDQYIAELRRNGVKWSRSHRDMLRARQDLYRQVADEVGAYPQRQAAPVRQGSSVHYIIDTEDSDALT
jgi:hypothetical protein